MNNNLVRVIQILNDGEYHDGNTLSKQLKITRAAVWKLIKKLKQYDVLIEAIKGKGYILREPFTLLDADQIQQKLKNEKIQIHIFESLTSTNDYLKTLKRKQDIIICLAEQQTKGRGRFNRHWHSPFGKNIYLSCLYPFQKDLSELAGLSLVTSLAVLETLKTYAVPSVFVKWPNDVLVQNKKCSGNLIEVQAETNGVSDAIIGIGMNVNRMADEASISQEWTSIQKATGKYIDRNECVVRLIQSLMTYLKRMEQHGFSSFVEEWVRQDLLTNKIITLKNLDQSIQGKVKGVNAQGYLLLQLHDGSERIFSSGEASIVKGLKI